MSRVALDLLAAALLALPWVVRRRWPWGRSHHARVAGRLLALFGGTAALALLLTGRVGAVVTFPAEFAAAQRLVAAWTGMPAPEVMPLLPLVAAMTGGGILAGLIARWRRRAPVTLGDVSAILPRTRRELGWGVVLSIDAGIVEELYFRLAVPLVAALLTGSALAGFALSAGLFAWAHRYQGRTGMAATFVVALLLSAAYLLTGTLWVAMVLHVALDLNGLVVRPLVAGVLRPPPHLASRA